MDATVGIEDEGGQPEAAISADKEWKASGSKVRSTAKLDVNASVYTPSAILEDGTITNKNQQGHTSRANARKGGKRGNQRKYRTPRAKYAGIKSPLSSEYITHSCYPDQCYIPVVNAYRVVDPRYFYKYGLGYPNDRFLPWGTGYPYPVGRPYNCLPFEISTPNQSSSRRFGNHRMPVANSELSARCLEQRQKQIDYGKNTVGYERYLRLVPKDKRTESDPGTPDKYMKCSKRCWSAAVRSWRLRLHRWDPPEDEKQGEESKKLGEMMSHLILSPNSSTFIRSLSPGKDGDEGRNLENTAPFGMGILKQRSTNSRDPDSDSPDSICVYDESEERPSPQNAIHNTPFDAETLEQKLKIWDEKFERCFRAGPVKGELETGSFFSSPFSGFGISPRSNISCSAQPPKFLAATPFSPSVIPTQNKQS